MEGWGGGIPEGCLEEETPEQDENKQELAKGRKQGKGQLRHRE